MLGRFGEIHEKQELLDWRQVGAMAIALIALGVGLTLEFGFGRHGWQVSSFYLLGVFLLGGPIVISAFRGLFAGHTNVDELVALALIASVAGGYFLEADVVAILMVAGSMFEQRASLRARRAIEQLLKIAPDEATLVHPDGKEERVPAESLRADQIILVRPGQRVAADGVIVSGGSTLDESAVTGESVPVYRTVSQSVFAGTLALDGSLTIKITHAGENSTVGQIVRIVREAEQYQAPVMRIADKWAKYYTPVILIAAAAALGISLWLTRGSVNAFELAWKRAVAVLVVGCPCTIVLATPTAIIAAMGRCARLGLLVKHGAILERAAQVDSLVFDKTGTLTTGKHQVSAIVPSDDLKGRDQVVGLCPAVAQSILALTDAVSAGPSASADMQSRTENLVSLAASVEHHSNHPFARALREYAAEKGITWEPATDAAEIPGVGISARVRGQPVLVGKPDHIARQVRNACAVPGTMLRPIDGYSPIAVEVAGKYAGLILLRDTLRPAAEQLVNELRSAGLTDLAVLSGDHGGAVKLVADQLRLDRAFAGLLPAEKARRVKALRDEGRVVAFVGDGINDAPAMAMADVAIAMGGTGTDLALQTADIVLLNDRIELLGTLFRLARKVRRVIHGNLFFGLALNLTALVLAGSGILSPMLGALVHNLGSAFVVANSARLAAFRATSRRPATDVSVPQSARRAA